MSIKKDFSEIFKKFQIYEKDITKIGERKYGGGEYSEVREIYYKNKEMVGKLIESDEEKKLPDYIASELIGQNIIKINKIYSKEFNHKFYSLIIMEKAPLRDLGKLNEFFHNHNLLKLIYSNPFDEKVGDNLLRFYSIQIIKALKILYLNNCIHFEIIPENLLVSVNLIIKLADFDLLSKIKEGTERVKLPEGTLGYITPEYYIYKYTSTNIAKKQDCFAFGSCLFKIKYGIPLLNYKKKNEGKKTADRITDLLIRNISYIKSNQLADKEFTNFLISLIQYKPDNRPSFENIFRNKWVNKNLNDINKVFMAFENDEEKLISELQKSDFLFKKEEFVNKNKNNSCKFRFKKKIFKKI